MESGTSGRYPDYPPSNPKPRKAGTNGGGGPPKNDACRENLRSVKLEEVARCDFYRARKSVPAIGTKVRVKATLVDGRLAVETASKPVVVGYLPTIYNYIRRCLAEDFSYEGEVIDSTGKPLPEVSVDLDWSK